MGAEGGPKDAKNSADSPGDVGVEVGRLYVLTAAVLWGTAGTAMAVAPAGAGPLAVGSVRLVLGGALLFTWAIVRGALPTHSTWQKGLVSIAVLGVASYQPFFFSAVKRTGVAVGTIVAVGSVPILTGLMGASHHGERLDRSWYIATALGVTGVTLLLGAGEKIQIDRVGLLFALGAGTAYAAYTTAAKSLLQAQPPTAVVGVVLGLGGLALAPLLWVVDLTWVVTPLGAAVALHLGIFATAVTYALFTYGVARTSVSNAGALALADPLTAGILGFTLLGERVTLMAGLGLVLVIFGLILVSIRSPEKAP